MTVAFLWNGNLEIKRNRQAIIRSKRFLNSSERDSHQYHNSRIVDSDRLGNDERLNSSEILNGKKRSIEKSNFWNFAPETTRPDENDTLPCESNLDADGPLPFGSYRMIGNPECDPKKTCLTTMSIDLMRLNPNPFSNNFDFSDIDVSKVVTNMQSMIDSGFTSFQIAPPITSSKLSPSSEPILNVDWMEASSQEIWSESNLYSRLLKSTPSSVMSSCQLTTRINLPPKNYEGNFGRGSIIRQIVGQKISRLGVGDSIDTLQLCYKDGNNPYILDILDILFEMKREGLIRSLIGVNMPQSLLDDAETCGFKIDSNQIACNLLNPNQFFDQTTGLKNDSKKKLLYSSPLAGGILSDDFFLNKFSSPPPYSMSRAKNWHIENSVRGWAKRHHGDNVKEVRNGEIWDDFHSRFYGTLKDIALKHQVSVSSIALRWAMQIGNLGSVVVASGFNGLNDDDRPFVRPHSLRQIYSFHLDDEDMEQLWDVSGKKEIVYENIALDDMDDYTGSFTPDFTNTKLWL